MQPLRVLLAVLVLGFVAYNALHKNPVPEISRAQPPGRPSADAECVLDHCEPVPPAQSAPAPAAQPPPAQPTAPAPAPASPASGPVAPGNFDFYVLSLSWSSGFCESAAGSGKAQCDAGSGLGFVVHGLWPQFEQGFPSDCGSGQPVSQSALSLTRGVFPDPGLARYEWGKHGTCTGLAPEAYFADVRRVRDSIVVPASFQAPREEQNLAPNDIMRAFTDANPRLRPGMLAVGCKGGVLEEVRFCLTKDLRSFRACQEVTQQSCHSRQLRVPPVR